GDVQQGQDDVLVGRRGQAVPRGRLEDDALLHALAGVAVVAARLVDRRVALGAVVVERLLALEHGDREVREVQLVAAVLVVLGRVGWPGPHTSVVGWGSVLVGLSKAVAGISLVRAGVPPSGVGDLTA